MIERLQAYALVEEHASLKRYNTYHIGGTTRYLLSPYSISDLASTIKVLRENKINYFILGNGSNIILNDREYDGAMIRLNQLNGIEVHPQMEMVYAEAGVFLPKLVIETVKASLTGLEFAEGIPGSVGGSIYGNAGAYNACLLDYVSSVTVLDEDLNIKIIDHEDIEYGYRTSCFKEKKNYIIVAAKFFLKVGDKENSLAIMADRKRRRLESQPLEFPSAGSVFRNPEGDYAGRLIESCQLKGVRRGGAEVSSKHANFIVNREQATSQDVYQLIHYVHDTVKEKTDVDLLIEQEFIDWE